MSEEMRMTHQHEKRISELEKKYQTLFGGCVDQQREINELREKLELERKVKIWDAKVINRTNKQLSELKSLITHSMHEGACAKLMNELKEEFIQIADSNSFIAVNNKEVLRDFMIRVGGLGGWDFSYFIKKLDSGDKMEKKEMKYIKKDIKDFKLDESIVFTNPKFDVPKHLKASGGDKVETEEESQREADKEEAIEVAQYLSLTDSKPPEPNLMGIPMTEINRNRHPKIVYQLGTGSKEYIELKKELERVRDATRQELISEIVEDLVHHYDYDYEDGDKMEKLIKKWEDKLK